ncbi:DUF3343 domain-containing protein [Clostridium sp. 'White wine YQ']|uniref:DUF3343 domain-containing protein n=1 Tax=Clostridium sp. 'White wine YQ' TaxID=3027474 RepID=UPI00236663BE|nr:DUF3343 domain-containing protein [Clostridium sp. 'White wine YQ']MDD7796101.1 DUF3343 domain-containing protein [Clostridium sp. 'White wine YQ']
MDNVCIIVFYSSSASLQLFKILKDKRYKVNIIATPCSVSSSCTRAIEFRKQDFDIIVKEIKDSGIEIKSVYEKVLEGKRYKYIQVMI